ncbi:MAG: hypothetical protein CL431_05840 [Acidimicrobiaceae bacterium]|jgi:hypothetical protein|nr:hypothetical protein [Acidimicrobiaceae bacterium]|tara:strand:- start:25191 stop:25574 length:384 start_codon:yes stop_codon:yes gene_type:complete
MENNDQVQLIIPTSSGYEEVAETTIAHLGLRSGFSLKEIENLRLVMKATTGMFFSMSEWDKPLHINFLFSHQKMQVTVTSHTTKPVASDENLINDYKNFVLPRVNELVVNREKSWIVFAFETANSTN